MIRSSGGASITGGAKNDTIFAQGGDSVFGGNTGGDQDVLDLSGIGNYRIERVPDIDGNGWDGRVILLDSNGNPTGQVIEFQNMEIVPCFTPGTLIATDQGRLPVEELSEGDRVLTRDNGFQEVRWVGRRSLGALDLAQNPDLRPVLIRRGAFGENVPERDMVVSPNHRMLMAGVRTELWFGEHEVLAAAKHLVNGASIQQINPLRTTYVHFLCDRHEVVLSDGAWSESFQPGDQSLKGMGEEQRQEIYALFPELRDRAGLDAYGAARRSLKGHEARILRHG
ncbi:MAG: Hint domain-containing protein [Exiguobacterium profundum]|nr:MAG: Hint domain-containing protein [Exiguobacterium profundum]